jgi:hypothetical protein
MAGDYRFGSTSNRQGKLTTVTGTSGLAPVDHPPVLSTTFKMPPDPLVFRKKYTYSNVFTLTDLL